MAPAPRHVLLVEDNAADVRLTMEAMRDASVTAAIDVVGDGVQALAYLRGGPGQPPVAPDLVLLDLNLPMKSGREVLSEIKADPALRRIPVVVLTTSSAEIDIEEAYDHGANCYLVKPLDFEQFRWLLRLLDQFWLEAVSLPPCPRGSGRRPQGAGEP